MAIERIGRHLARYIGPYNQYAVRAAAAEDPDPIAIRAGVGQEIEDPLERQRFLDTFRLASDDCHLPGYVFRLQEGAYSRISSPALRAVGGAVIASVTLAEAS